MNLDKALEGYEIDARARGYSPHTITHVKGCVGFLAAFLSDVPDVSRVTADDFRRFLSSLCDGPVRNHPAHEQKHKVGPTSINTYARAIKSFWSWLEEEGIVTANPLASVKTPKKPKTIPKTYTEQELKAILNTISAMPRESSRHESEIISELLRHGGLLLEEEVFLLLISKVMDGIQEGRLHLPISGDKLSQVNLSRGMKTQANKPE